MACPKVKRVGMVCRVPTTRLLKESQALLSNGVECDIFCNIPGDVAHIWNHVHLWVDDSQLRREMRDSNVDVFHVHNQPDELLQMIGKDYRPTICDVHDLHSVITGEIRMAERAIYDRSDGILHVSAPMQEHFRKVHGNGKPDTVIENFNSKAWLAYAREKERPYPGPKDPLRIVYEGGLLGGKVGGKTESGADETTFAYYDQRDSVMAFKEAGIEFHIYPGPCQTGEETHKEIGAIVHPTGRMPTMLPEIGTYRWGFIGNINKYRQWDVAMPNKMFDYITAGIPVVAFNARTAGEFLEREGMGINVTSAKELVERNGEAEKCRENVLKKAESFTWEQNIHKLERLYEAVS